MLEFDEHILTHISKYVGNLEEKKRRRYQSLNLWGDLSVKRFLEAEKAEQVVCKELPASSIEQGQFLRIEIVLCIIFGFQLNNYIRKRFPKKSCRYM